MATLILLIIVFGLICFFILIPLKNVGLIRFLYYEKEMNPIVRRVVYKYLNYKNNALIKYLISNVEIIDKTEIQHINWVLDSSFKGIDSLYCLDQYSDDVRALLSTSEDIMKDNYRWFRANFTNQYFFYPLHSPNPRYKMEKGFDWIKINTPPIPDTWIYLASKDKYPNIYAISFDIILHQVMKETLQICFYCQSLAKRLRFILDDNKYLRFEIVDKGCFSSKWHKLNKECSLPLHKTVNVRLEVINNIFALYLDNVFQMAIRIKKYKLENGYWYIIFWNGKKTNVSMSIEIENLRVYLDEKNNRNLK